MKIFSLIITLLYLMFFMLCTEPSTTGTGHEGEAVMGYIHDAKGEGVINVKVELLPINFNPVKQNDVVNTSFDINKFTTISKENGKYIFSNIVQGNYSLIGVDNTSMKAIYHSRIEINETENSDTIVVGCDTLIETGVIIVSVPDSLFTEDCYVYIPGTNFSQKIDSIGKVEINAPEGIVDVILYNKVADSTIIDTAVIVENVVVIQGITVDSSNNEKNISTPKILTGDDTLIIGEEYECKAGEVVCDNGDTVEYRFDWGDSTFSNWIISVDTIGYEITCKNSWNVSGTYYVRAKVRIMDDTSIVSGWSIPIKVYIVDTVTIPIVMGDSLLFIGDTGKYWAENSKCSNGDPVEYRIDFGDTLSTNEWISDSEMQGKISKVWLYSGLYKIKAQARSAYNDKIVSNWSSPFLVSVEKDSGISTPSIYSDTNINIFDEVYIQVDGAASSNSDPVEYQIDWGDTTFSSWIDESDSITGDTHTYVLSRVYELRVKARKKMNVNIYSNWSSPIYIVVQDTGNDDLIIKIPKKPYGNQNVAQGVNTKYVTGGSHIFPDMSAQYRFDWGNNTISSWVLDTSQTFSWNTSGEYTVRAQARKVSDTSIVSKWSAPLIVFVIDSSGNDTNQIESPFMISGLKRIHKNISSDYGAGGGGNLNMTIEEYRFNWGNGEKSDWANSKNCEYSWDTVGIFNVHAKGRSNVEPFIETGWSVPYTVTVIDTNYDTSIVSPYIWIENDSFNLYDSVHIKTGGCFTHSGIAEYRFDWGDSSISEWEMDSVTFKICDKIGVFRVRTQGRDLFYPKVVSDWSEFRIVTILNNVVKSIRIKQKR